MSKYGITKAKNIFYNTKKKVTWIICIWIIHFTCGLRKQL